MLEKLIIQNGKLIKNVWWFCKEAEPALNFFKNTKMFPALTCKQFQSGQLARSCVYYTRTVKRRKRALREQIAEQSSKKQ